jgi:flagellar basal body P-ring formation protein FlgA
VVGRMPRRAIRTGLPVFRLDLIEPFQVRRGDLVDVTAISGAAQLRMPALAETQGRQGDIISLKNPRTGKLFRARIEGKDKALVLPWPLSDQTIRDQAVNPSERVQ